MTDSKSNAYPQLEQQLVLEGGDIINLYITDKASVYTINGGLPYLQGYTTLGGPEWSDIAEACRA